MIDTDRLALQPANTPADDVRRASDIDCCTPRSELSFGHWKDKHRLSDSPQSVRAAALPEPLPHAKAGNPSADSAAHIGSLSNAAGGTATVTAAEARPQGQSSPAAGNDGGAVAQAAGAVQPEPAAPQPATDAKPAKRQSREDHLS